MFGLTAEVLKARNVADAINPAESSRTIHLTDKKLNNKKQEQRIQYRGI
jgi:hypothetical protein